MDTIHQLNELLADRNLTLYEFAKDSSISFSTLNNAERRGNQLSLDTIERICEELNIKMYEFFMTDDDWNTIEAYVMRRNRNVYQR